MASRRAASTLVSIALVTLASPALAEPNTCAQSLESVNRLREERRLLVAKALAHECSTSAACAPEARVSCAAADADLAHEIPTITVVVDGDAGRTTLSLDGAAVTAGVAYSVDPGQHTIVLAAIDGRRREENVLVAKNDRARIVMLAPSPMETASVTTPSASPASNGPYFVMGGGLLLLLGAATMQTFARVEEADSKSLYRDASQEESQGLRDLYRESAVSHHDAAVTNQTFAISLAALGAVTLAVGATWWFTSRSTRSDPKTGLLARPFRLTF